MNNHLFKDDSSYFERVKNIYSQMDNKYNEVAEYYKFKCAGCEDNCCNTSFYHHTYIEFYYILFGFSKLSEDKKAKIKKRAQEVIEKTIDLEREEKKVWLMCPLNIEGLCGLYEYRPMICRLHGLAHELRKPGQFPLRSRGCEDFIKKTKGVEYLESDRTPFYIMMATLEKELRNDRNLSGKIKKTIAEMIINNESH